MFLVFLYEESYLKFLVNYLETKKLDPNEEDEDSDQDDDDDEGKNKKGGSRKGSG